MARRIQLEQLRSLDEHAGYVQLAGSVARLRKDAEPVARRLHGRTVWMVNSTAQGGGVSEMLPGVIGHLRELGVSTEWAVIEAADPAFFDLTKRLHNMLHGQSGGELTRADRELYEAVNRRNADALRTQLQAGDVLAVHDPQPLPLAGLLEDERALSAVWRCHIGLDEENAATSAAWSFLDPYLPAYDHAVFSAPEYIPARLADRSSVIYPAIDPLAPKNCPLRVPEVVSTLLRAGLVDGPASCTGASPAFSVQRLHGDGTFRAAAEQPVPGLLTRPVIAQISRWDRLKGFLPLMHGFVRFRERLAAAADSAERQRLALSRLVLAGPDPDSIADDPEGRRVLDELIAGWLELPESMRDEIVLLALPMRDLSANALIVNALQRVSTVVAQNSLREGFGLTITEAMWKSVPVLSNARACGPRQQVRDGRDGRLIADPEDADEIATALHSMLADPSQLDAMGRSAERRAHDHFLIYGQLRQWLRLLDRVAT